MQLREVLTKGQLKSGESFHIQRLTMNDIPKINRLQDTVVEKLHDSNMLVTLSDSEIQHILLDGGLFIGVFIKERLIACRAFLIPDIDDPEHLGYDARIPKGEFPEVIYSEISMVDPSYRGNRLQTFMGKILIELVKQSNFKYVLTTVAPNNIPSLKDKFALGMRIVHVKEKYGGKLRFILYRHVHKTSELPVKDERLVPIDNMKLQEKLLKLGYCGIEIQANGKIKYEKRGD